MRRIALALAVLAVLIIGATSARGYFFGGWPETCLEMNDMVEVSEFGSGAVGIYQKAFGDGPAAQAACQRDHRQDVRRAFAWAIGPEPTTTAEVSGIGPTVSEPIALAPGLYTIQISWSNNRSAFGNADNFIAKVVRPNRFDEGVANEIAVEGVITSTFDVRDPGETVLIQTESVGQACNCRAVISPV